MGSDFFDIVSSKNDNFEWNNQRFKKNVKGIILPDTEAISLESGWADMNFHYIDREKYTLFVNFYDVRQRRQTRVRSDKPSVEFNMMLMNQVINKLAGFKDSQIKEKFFNINFMPFVDSIVNFEAGQLYCTLDIHLKKGYLQDLLKDFPSVMEPLMNAVEKKTAKSIFPTYVPATIFMAKIADSILQSLTKGTKLLLVVDKDVEALIAHAVSYNMDSDLSRPEMDQHYLLNQVHQKIMEDFAIFPSMKVLCKIARMNQTTLNLLYKQQFNLPMQQSWINFRLDKAYYMLFHDTHLKIKEIGEMLGYSSAVNFTKAFKAKFKKSPSQVRKNLDDFNPAI